MLQMHAGHGSHGGLLLSHSPQGWLRTTDPGRGERRKAGTRRAPRPAPGPPQSRRLCGCRVPVPAQASVRPCGAWPGLPAPLRPSPAGPRCRGRRTGQGGSRAAPGSAMGLETEKADTRIFMDDDNFPPGGPELSEGEKCAEDGLERDPRGLNAHLQVPGGAVGAAGPGPGGG